ncbi:hypothetical protein L1987_51245 [Smallanthus sonchifolius]|uniref:Uncharacterized protein n=1 Tax=Smallanthus sonchifolius TaxID=185202 RepID=A0ACB9EQ45_9ASTR|nr:hypothetical protein L1987_51245 [Smallanthus sonchifolius]
MEAAPATIANSGVIVLSHQPPAQPDVNGGGGDDGGSIGGGFAEDVERNSGGNRWPKQETLALIRIRSEMDAAFRDSNLKGPLWDEVSRKLSELGFHRNAKKCREKFENVYKYHRRTKEGRTSKSDKIYRFSDQLQALESNHRGAFPPPSPLALKPPPVYVAMSNNATIPLPYNGVGLDQNNVSPISVAAPAVVAMPPPPMLNHKRAFPFSQPNQSESTDLGSSSDTSDDEPPHKKRKWEDFFEKLMKELIEKQEEVQMKFLDTLDRRERDRVAKEEAWRSQEIAKMNQEHDRLVKERSMVAAKDAAIATFLQKLIGKSVDVVPVTGDDAREKITDVPQQTPPPPPAHQPSPPPSAAPSPPPAKNLDTSGRVEENATPSRWPKAEIDALISLRSQLDIKYQENVPKGPLWEEISAAMKNIGYHRNAKRCKEKWENINKYYKKIKESNKKRPEDSKTCTYFDQLDALYRRKSTPIIAQPEQQWPPDTEKPRPLTVENMEDHGSEEFDDFEDDDEAEAEAGAGAYEIVASKVSSI